MTLRIAIDAHMVGQRETGNETYVLGLLHGLAQVDKHNHYFVLVTDPHSLHARIGLPENFTVIPLKPATDLLRVPLAMPWVAHRLGIDLLHVTYVAPPVSPCARIVTVHDISFKRFPHFFSLRDRLMLSTLVPLSMRLAKRVIVEAEFTRQDIIARYGLPTEKLAVIPLAPSAHFAPVRDGLRLQEIREKYELSEQFVLAVGNLQPRKNLTTLFSAVTELKTRGDKVQLAVVGQAHWQAQTIFQHAGQAGSAHDIRFLGYVPDEDLQTLYSAACVFAFPSLYEGFGLPPLEAMACGTPVICSNTSTLPEVVGDAGLLLPSQDVSAWADALQSVLRDPALRDNLARRGLARAAELTWEGTARKTLEIYERVAGSAKKNRKLGPKNSHDEA